MPAKIPFHRPTLTGGESRYLEEALDGRSFAGGGPFTQRCRALLEDRLGRPCLLTTSCTAALEMAALLCDVGPGDEVILPSFAFSSAATAFVRTGAELVFVDIDPGTMNLDPAAVEAAIGPRSRVVVALDYGGFPADLSRLRELTRRHGLRLVEDAAQAYRSEYRGSPCGTDADFGCISFHESKNLHCGEGGALILGDESQLERAEVLLEKGTDRSRFFRGEVDRYTWQDVGSSFVLSDLNAAFLLAQLEAGEEITRRRVESWNRYHELFEPLREELDIQLPPSSDEQHRHNGHIYWLLLPDGRVRDQLLESLRSDGIGAVFHYIPLHSAPAGRRYGRFAGRDRHTTSGSERLLRLPLFDEFQDHGRVLSAIRRLYPRRP